jgi:bifunctional non-homologous end joining protein LigD
LGDGDIPQERAGAAECDVLRCKKCPHRCISFRRWNAKRVGQIPDGAQWQYELKLDGCRAIAVKQNGEVKLFSRNGNSFNSKFPAVVRVLEDLRPKRFVVDGEIVALDENGRHSFALLQRIKTSKAPLRFYLFDLLHVGADDLMKQICEKRRARLEDEFRALPESVQLSPILTGNAEEVLARVREFEFEGVVAKRLDFTYRPGETPGTWQKHKTQRSDDFLIGGYIPGRYGVDELVVGEKRAGKFHFVESVKNGFVPSTRQRVFDAIKGKEIDACPFVNLPEKKGAHRMDREKMETVRLLKPKTSLKLRSISGLKQDTGRACKACACSNCIKNMDCTFTW